MVALMAVGIVAGPRSAPTRPGLADAGLGEPSQEQQSIPARLWQDPLEATEGVRRSLRVGEKQETTAHTSLPLERLIHEHAAHFDGVPGPDGKINFLSAPHRVLFEFVSLPSDAYPEAGEQRIRARVAVVSALSTAGFRPVNAARLGVAVWDASATPERPITTQNAYPFEVFELDLVRFAFLSPEEQQLALMMDEVVVLYVEDGALRPDQQFEWLKRLSRLVAAASPQERFTKRQWIFTRWLGPITSDRLVALLRTVSSEYASGGNDLQPPIEEVAPVTVLAVRPTIEPSFVKRLIVGRDVPKGFPAADDPRAQFVKALSDTPRQIPLTVRCEKSGGRKSWLTLERLGCSDEILTEALVHELKLRRPDLFDPKKDSVVALLSEWDTLYGIALPESFANRFEKAGGKLTALKSYTYLRGLDGQTPSGLEKTIASFEKQRTEVAKPPDSMDLFRQLLRSHAPGISFGRTQVDYIDRLAAQLRMSQRANPEKHLEAIGVLGSDPYDKLLILQGLRKVFPSVEYFTTELDASLFAPENYDVTRNLVVTTGFDLQLHEKYQQKILPFRDSAQASLYFATLHATAYFMTKQKGEIVGAPLDAWFPSVVEIGRSGPYVMKTVPSIGSPVVEGSSDKGKDKNKGKLSPLAVNNVSLRESWQRWLVPLVALAIVVISTMTYFGRLAVRDAVKAMLMAWSQLSRLWGSGGRLTRLRRLSLRVSSDLAVWLLIIATLIFVGVAFCIPLIAELPDQEPFLVAEGISSWPATWLRSLGVFLCACYFWIITWQFRHALGSASRDLVLTVPDCCPLTGRPARPSPCKAWERFRRRSRGWQLKVGIILAWAIYLVVAITVFSRLDLPAPVTRGGLSIAWEKDVLMCAVLSINLLIAYAVAHNLSCSFFVRNVAEWLRRPDAPEADVRPLHTALMRAVGHVAGAMTQMIYYPFTLLFLLIAARNPLFDNFDWPVVLIVVFSISSGVLLGSTLILRRSADQARKNAIAWLERRIALLKWQLTGFPDDARPELERTMLVRAEWQLAEVNKIGGAALSEGFLSNPLLRAVLIPLGGTGVLQLMEVAGKFL
jgi:hypothetical protein